MAGRQWEAWAAPSEKSRLKTFSLNIAAMSFVVGEPPLPKNYREKVFTEYVAVSWAGGPFLAAETSRIHMKTQWNGVLRILPGKFFLPLIN